MIEVSFRIVDYYATLFTYKLIYAPKLPDRFYLDNGKINNSL